MSRSTSSRQIFGGSPRSWRRRTIDVRNLAIAAEGQPRARGARPGFPLTGTAEQYGVPVAEPHEAFDDALVTAQLFLVLTSHLGRRDPLSATWPGSGGRRGCCPPFTHRRRSATVRRAWT